MAHYGLAKPYNADVLSMIDAYYLIKVIASNMHKKMLVPYEFPFRK